MKNILPVFALALLGLTSCQNSSKTNTSADSSKVSVVDSLMPTTQCYTYIKNRDTAILKLNTTGNSISGDLNYRLYEKDSNSGTISGIVKGDTLIADYTFQSEGSTSVREVVFLKKGDALVEGFGPVEESAGKTKFKNKSALNFGDAMVFGKTTCN